MLFIGEIIIFFDIVGEVKYENKQTNKRKPTNISTCLSFFFLGHSRQNVSRKQPSLIHSSAPTLWLAQCMCMYMYYVYYIYI